MKYYNRWGPRELRFRALTAEVGNVSECWIWRGRHISNGYGVYHQTLAHRMAWEQVHGPIPPNLDVCHHCDERLCVNPHHLFLGTRKENLQDMAAKGRSQWGERNKSAKLMSPQVLDIVRRYEAGESGEKIARSLGLGFRTIYDITQGRTWSRVTHRWYGGPPPWLAKPYEAVPSVEDQAR